MTNTEAMSTEMADIIRDLRGLHKQATPGEWGKGQTTHHTVSKRPGEKPYRIAEFHHAADASFCDFAHRFMPMLLDEIERLASRSSEDKGVPPGFVMVPVEPTAEMRDAADKLPDCFSLGDEYRAMVKAAPRAIEGVPAGVAGLGFSVEDGTITWADGGCQSATDPEIAMWDRLRATEAGTASAEQVARKFHEAYERLAPAAGYETRTETRQFDPASANGKLMIAVCAELFAQSAPVDGGGAKS